MDRRTFVKVASALSGAFLFPSLARASDADPLRLAALHTFSESGTYDVDAHVEASPHPLLPGRIELVREDGTVLDSVSVPTGDRDDLFSVMVRSRFGRGEHVGLRLHTSYVMKVDDFHVEQVPEIVATEPFGVWVRDSRRCRAARRAREMATRLDRTLYLGRDVRNGEWLGFSGFTGRIWFRDQHYGEHPIPPRGHYWEPRLVAEGRAVWL